MTVHEYGIIMNGVTGRMGTRQHLVRSVLQIIDEGGVPLDNGDVIMPVPLLVGRNEEKLRDLGEKYKINNWTTSLEEALSNEKYQIYFDSQTTSRRASGIKKSNKCR